MFRGETDISTEANKLSVGLRSVWLSGLGVELRTVTLWIRFLDLVTRCVLEENTLFCIKSSKILLCYIEGSPRHLKWRLAQRAEIVVTAIGCV